MKSLENWFSESKRLQPRPDLWHRISTEVNLSAVDPRRGRILGGYGQGMPAYFKFVASMTLAAGLLGLGLLFSRQAHHAFSVGNSVDSTLAQNEAVDFLDPDLLDWDADLGEVQFNAGESAEELIWNI